MGTNKNTFFFFYFEDIQTLEQVNDRGCGDIQNQTAHDPRQSALGDHA